MSATEEKLLALDPRFSHVVEYDEALVLVDDEDATVLEGSAVGELVALLDGTLSASGIAASLRRTHAPEVVYEALRRLREKGVVRVVDAVDDPAGASACAGSAGYGASDAAETAPEQRHDDRGEARSSCLASSIRSAWGQGADAGVAFVPWCDPLTRMPLELLITDDYLRGGVVGWNRRALATGRPFLVARLAWDSVWLGPLVVPRLSACLKCLDERLRLNLTGRALLHPRPNNCGAPGDRPVSNEASNAPVRIEALRPAAPPDAVGRLARLVEDRLAGEHGSAGLRDKLVVRRRGAAEDEVHDVDRLPHCPHCGDPAKAPPGPRISVTSRKKVPGSRSGYRIEDARTTLARIERHVSPLTGLVRVVDRVHAGGTDLVHVYTANHPVDRRPPTLQTVAAGHRDRSGGKGVTDVDAKVSALGEALERASATHRGCEPEHVASLEELAEGAVAPNEILLFSESQFAEREELDDTAPRGFHWVPEPYPKDEPISWTEVRSLTTGERRFVPTAAVYTGFSGAGSRHCRADSNGLAAGNCVEEAILQGFLELVERDAVAIWWYNRLRRPGVDLDSFVDPWIAAVGRHHERIGRRLWALDLTSDLGVPCFAAFSAKAAVSSTSRGPVPDRRASEDIILGFGAHFEAGIALRRAVTEVNQMLPTALRTPAQRREQLLPDFRDALEWLATATRAAHPHLVPDPESRHRRRSDYAEHRSPDLRDDVDACVSIADEHGMDLLACDLTRRDIGLSVVRVLVPGLRHFWRRLGPGRLYDVPVALGDRERPTPEAEMNPISMFV